MAPRAGWAVDCGRMPYAEAWALQRAALAARQQGRIADVVLLVEHPAVITVGRAGRAAHILVPRDALAARGIEVEVLDLRTLLPLDCDAIAATARKTSKVLILHEDTRTGGIAGEITAILQERCFDDLDGPILRLTSGDAPVPFSPPLEEAFLPSAQALANHIERLARF